MGQLKFPGKKYYDMSSVMCHVIIKIIHYTVGSIFVYLNVHVFA